MSFWIWEASMSFLLSPQHSLQSAKACLPHGRNVTSDRENACSSRKKTTFYGCETWSHSLTKESRLQLFENSVFGTILGPKRDELTEGWWKIHTKELHSLKALPSLNITGIIEQKKIILTGYVARMVDTRNAYTISVGKSHWERNRFGEIDVDGRTLK